MPETDLYSGNMELRNIKIRFISLVKAGANKKQIIWKSSDGGFELVEIPISKRDDEKQVIYGVVYSPDEFDTDGEFASKKEIRKAAYLFMKESNTGTGVDKDHSFSPEKGVYVAETWILKENDPTFSDEKPGSWAVGIKVDDDEIWKQVKSGDINGLSMGGVADKHKPTTDIWFKSESQLRKWVSNLFNQTEEDEMKKEDVEKIVADAIEKAPKALTTKEMGVVLKAAIEETVKPLVGRLDKIEKTTKGSGQDDDEVKKSDKDLVKMGLEIAKEFNEED